MRNKLYKNCLTCNKLFRTFPSEIKRGHGKYCSTKCQPRLGVKKGNTPWNKGKKGVQTSYWKGKKLPKEVREKISLNHAKAWLGRKHTDETITKMVKTALENRTNHHNWKGGITPQNYAIRNSSKYRQWRKIVYKRDDYTCQVCGSRNGNGKAVYLNADHIKPFAFYPELRFEITNGRTLCLDCHKETDTYGRRYHL